MSKCGNCKTKLGCSCKKRTASDGKSCCANCLSNYEKIIKKKTNRLQVQPGIEHNNTSITAPGVILSVKAEQK
jgi:hypothetical protein